MEEKTDKKPEQEKPKRIQVPTQKTFTFNTLFNSQEKIDATVNKWLKDKTMMQQQPFLGKVSVTNFLFWKNISYVYMYGTIFELKPKP